MPAALTYPGVYIEEIPSGVRTITGVATSITAFVGGAKRGPINKATRVLNFADFERRFGGLDADSEMSYAVRQFFLNGGSETFVVRLAKDPQAAAFVLANTGTNVLKVTAKDQGSSGNNLEVRVDFVTGNPASTFNLLVNYASPDNPSENRTEQFANLSMNSGDVRYAVDFVNAGSELVQLERLATVAASKLGTSGSGGLTDAGALVDATHRQLRLAVNGLPPVPVTLDSTADVAGADAAARLATLCAAIQAKVRAAAGGQAALNGFACAPDGNKIKMTSGKGGENSSVRVLPGLAQDAAARLKLGTNNGGTEADAAASIRPDYVPMAGTLTSGTLADPDINAFDPTELTAATSTSGTLADVQTLVDATHTQFRVAVNGLPPVTVTLDSAAAVAGADAAARLATLCGAIQTKIRAAAGGAAALANFACAPDGTKIKLTSGEAGESSSVRVLPGLAQDASVPLKLGPDNGGNEIAARNSFRLKLDDFAPVTVQLPKTALAGDKLADLAARIQAAVRALKPNAEAFQDFTCQKVPANKLVLASGTRGEGSRVQVDLNGLDSLAATLKLTTGTLVPGVNQMLIGGAESPFTDADAYGLFIGKRDQREGIFALEAVDLFNLLCLPGVTDSGILADAVGYCQERRAFLIVDAPPDKDKPDEMETFVTGPDLPKHDHAAVYYPWISIADPLKAGRPRPVAPSGTVAGLYARTDSTRGVWKAPAGTEATLNGVQRLAYTLTDLENGTLNPHGVNCLRLFPVFGPIVWGARTLRGDDQMADQWKYIPVRRLALFIEESLFRGTKWVVFEPNDEPLWAQIRLNLGAFMHGLFRQGAFQGMTPRDAYFVKCDKETTTQDDINRGIVNIVVGFAPLKPAEFVVIKLQQMAGQIQT